MSYILVMYIYAGALSKGDSVTITHIDNFKTESLCRAAGDEGKKLVQNTFISCFSYGFCDSGRIFQYEVAVA